MTAWLIQTLVATMLLMAIVLMARGPIGRSFGPRIAYALWLLPALRMALPPLPGWTTLFGPIDAIDPAVSLVGLSDAMAAVPAMPIEPGAIPAQTAPPALAVPLPPAAIAADPVALLLALWLGVAALYFGWQMVRYRLFLRAALRGAVRLTTECGVEVLVSPNVTGPVAVGILRRRIFLPADFLARYTPEERRLALLHEAAHHDRLDIAANLAALAVRALHWWNPLAQRAYTAFRADQELACDATVLAGAAADQRIVYGRALLKSASSRTPPLVCALDPKNALRQRIGMIARPIGRVRLMFGAALALVMIGAGMMMTASGLALPPVPAAPPIPARTAEVPLPPRPIAEPRLVSAVRPIPAAPAAIADPPAPPAAPAAPAPALAPAVPVPPAPPAPPQATDVPRVEPCPEERRAGEEAAAEARRAAWEARREAEQARREAEREARVAQREALAEARAAQARVPAMVRASLASVRRGMADACARQGVSLSSDADWAALATCGPRLRETLRASLSGIRASLARNRALSDEKRADALSGIDDALAEFDDALPGQ